MSSNEVSDSVPPSAKPIKVKKCDFIDCLVDILGHDPISRFAKMSKKFHVIKDGLGGREYLEELGDQLLRPIAEREVAGALSAYQRKHLIDLKGIDWSNRDFDDAVRRWADITPSFSLPIFPVLPANGRGHCWHKLPFEFAPGELDSWNDVLSRMTNAKAFCAYIGSLFDPLADRQQYLWMYGSGENSKGSILRFLSRCLGVSASSEFVPAKDDKFWTAGLLGKRLIVFPDCNNFGFVTTGLFKSLTGGDAIRIERKFKAPFSTQLGCKFIFASNKTPMISSKKADMRRIIFCALDPIRCAPDSSFEQRLWNEAPAFLSHCWQLYNDLCPDHQIVPTDAREAEDIASRTDGDYEDIWDMCFEPAAFNKDNPETYVVASVFSSILDAAGVSRSMDQADFYEWAVQKYKIGFSQPWLPFNTGLKRMRIYTGVRWSGVSISKDSRVCQLERRSAHGKHTGT